MDEPSSKQHQQKSSWAEVAKKRIAQPKVWITTAFVVAFLLAWSLFNVRESTLFPLSLKARDWTGFGADSTVNTERNSANKVIKTVEVGESSKTLWDWLSVLGVPLTLALLGFWFQWLQQKQSAQQAEVEKEIVETTRKEEAMQAYFDRLSDLLVDKNLIAIASKVQSFEVEAESSKEGSRSEEIKLPASLQVQKERLDAAVDVVRARTLAILRRLEDDASRKTSIVRFLVEAEVIQKLKLSLRGADLSGVRLFGADFSRADFSRADFSRAILSCADLSCTDLSDAKLNDAKLKGANLRGADLRGAKLRCAKLFGADLSGAKLSRAILSDANLNDTKLNDADFSRAYLSRAILSGANLNDADLSGADLSYADLSYAKLRGTKLSRAKLRYTDFSHADLSGADLFSADIAHANLSYADLSEAKNLTEEQLTQAKLCQTKLSLGIDLNPGRDCKELENE
ncbi:MAG TPA: pentapeptide repeat-containing protein [Coleofasciculaceae cyanobacterium]